MRPEKGIERDRQGQLFGIELERLVDSEHELVALSKRLKWELFEEQFGEHYHVSQGRPGVSTRLMVGLHYLKYSYDLSDESVVERWVENPYWQYFCGEKYFQYEFPIHPTSMTKWRQKVGVKGAEQMLRETVELALRCKVVSRREFEQLNVDTTVQEKAITHPTDSKLYFKMRMKLVILAKRHGIVLRQSYVRVARKALCQGNRYFFARQPKRARRQVRKLKTYLRRVVADISRKIADDPMLQEVFSEQLALAHRLLAQEKNDKNKLYSLHAPEVECIAKGKAHKKYEFGSKVSVVSTSRKGLILGINALHGNPYDGHTLQESMTQAERISGQRLSGNIVVDRGYRGHNYTGPATVHIAGKKVSSPSLRKWIRRRSAIEAKIAHLKCSSAMDRNYLLGKIGDQLNAIFCGAAVNLRMIIAAIRARFFAPDPFKPLNVFTALQRYSLTGFFSFVTQQSPRGLTLSIILT